MTLIVYSMLVQYMLQSTIKQSHEGDELELQQIINTIGIWKSRLLFSNQDTIFNYSILT